MMKKITLFLLFQFLFQTVWGNGVNYYYDRLSLNEGLSQSTAKVIFRDRIGMLWVGTKDGLNRYDGYEIESYYHDANDAKSIPNNNILFIVEDAAGNLWIGTNGALCRYDRLSNSFVKEMLNGDPVIAQSALRVEHLLYLVNENCIFTYNSKNQQWIKNTFKGATTNLTMNTKLAIWNNKIVVSSMWRGLFVVEPTNGVLTRTPFFDNDNVLSIHVDAKQQLWVSQLDKGVFCFDKNGRIKLHLHAANTEMKLNKVMYMLAYKDQMLLATDGNGLYFYSQRLNRYTQVKSNQDNPFTYPLNSILSLYSDEYANLWLGTIRGGAIGLRHTYIRPYTNAAFNSASGLSGLTVLSFHQEADGMIWIGTDGEGINSFDPETQKFRHFPSSFGKKVSGITYYGMHELLLSLYNQGLVIFDKRTGAIKELLLKNQEGVPIKLNNLIGYNLVNTADGNIYISDGNVHCYHRASGHTSLLKNAEPNDGYLRIHHNNSHPKRLFLYGNSKVWEYNTEAKLLRLLCKTNTERMGVINNIEVDKKGTLWLGTSNGLYEHQEKQRIFRKVISNQFKSIALLLNDNFGSLWIGSGLELFQYRVDTKQLYNYQKSDGVNPNEYLPKSKLLSSNGDIYLGGVSGFVCIDKHIPLKAIVTPTIELLNIQLNGTVLAPEKIKTIGDIHIINIPWNFNSLRINFFSNTPDLNTKTRSRYRFAHTKNDFSSIEKNEIQLQALAPGKYEVEIQHEIKNEQWSVPVPLLTIRVTPPWWQTWWFMLVAFVVILVALFLFRRNAIRKTKRSMEMQIQTKEREISEQKVKFLINISHELRTPLTLVYSPLRRILIDEQISEGIKPTLTLMYKHVKNMKNTIDMVLDVRKMDFKTDVLKLRTQNLNQWIQSIVDDFDLEIKDKKIEIQYILDAHIDDFSFDEEKCVKVLSNLLMNAIKFSAPASSIVVQSALMPNGVRISVLDQGIGIAQEDTKQLFSRFFQGKHEKGGTGIGLSFAKTLVELQGGKIGYEPNADKGSVFWFELPFTQTNHYDSNVMSTLLQYTSESEFDTRSTMDFSLLNNLTALIVEDEIDLLNYMKAALTPVFKKVVAVSNGQKAWDEMHALAPDIVISDVMMPEMDGFEMCKRIKSDIEVSHIPVVLLTALGDEESSLIGYKMGADMYLSKPFAIDLLLTIIGNLFHSRWELKKRYAHYSENIEAKEITFSNADERFVTKLTALIDSRLDDAALRIDDLAVEMAMSRTSFYKKMKLITGLSANAFLTDYKIKKAIVLLQDPDIQIQEIALQLGFENQRYFSTVFKQTTGKTPTQYRENKEE